MATDQKIENLLNLALDATPEEREKSLVLDVGFDPVDRRWDIIVKYTGDLSARTDADIRVTELSNGYAVLNLPESRIDEVSDWVEIEYIEKPKRLFFAANQGRSASCMNALQNAEYDLFGQGVIMAVIDSGVDYFHDDFRNDDGSTRILEIWDQTISGTPPEGFVIGSVYSREQINQALTAPTQREGYTLVPSRDISGHGTQVLGIAAGNGRASNGFYRGVAPQCEIIAVKLGLPVPDSFPRTTELMQAVDYVIKRAVFYGRPVVINLSFGTVYGSHDGTALLETYLNDVSDIWKSVIVTGTGNEGATAGHTSGNLVSGVPVEISMGISQNEQTVNLQLWKSYVDTVDVEVIDPAGRMVGPFQERLGPQRFLSGSTQLLVYYGNPSPFSMSQEIYIDFLPLNQYIDSGVWIIRLTPRRIVDGYYNMWLPATITLNRATSFYAPTVQTTLTIPSTAEKVITVAAYDSRNRTYAPFSGRGYDRLATRVKPDIAAPGVDINTTAPGGGYTAVSGTSFATPFVSGAAAMLMQWGIVEGNDPYLYGEKLKAYLRRGAQHIDAEPFYPNPTLGYGVLCVRDSLPF